MKKQFLLVTTIICSGLMFGQTQFAGHIAGPGGEVPYNMISDNSGNILLCGVFDATVDFDPTAGFYEMTSVNPYDGFIAKYDSSGSLIWAKQFGTYIYFVEVDALNNIYATGRLEGTKDVDPSPANYELTSNGLTDGVMIKLTNAGELIWAFNIGGEGTDGMGSIQLNDNNEIYVSGGFTEEVDFDPSGDIYNLTPTNPGIYVINTGFIAKYDTDANFIWAKRIATAGNINLHKDVPAEEYFILSTAGFSASSTDSADYDPSDVGFVSPVPDPLPDGNYMAIIKYDADGNYIWSQFPRTYGSLGVSDLVIYDVDLDVEENIYFTGSFQGSFDEYPENIISLEPFIPFTGSPDGLLIKLDLNGNLVWEKRFGSGYAWDYGSDLILDHENNIHLIGSFQYEGEFNEGGTSEILESFGSYDMFITGFSTDGEFLYKGHVGATGSDGGMRIITQGNNIVTTGIFEYTVDCDPFGTETFYTAAGYQDIFLTGYHNEWATEITDTTIIDTTLLILQNEFNFTTEVFPNPFTNYTSLKIDADGASSFIIKVYDLTGRLVETLISSENNASLIIGRSLGSGTYLVKVETENASRINYIIKTE